jgi:hypothetical protein
LCILFFVSSSRESMSIRGKSFLRGLSGAGRDTLKYERMTMRTKADRIKVPKFPTEADQAKWWDDHKDMVEEDLIRALDLNKSATFRNRAPRPENDSTRP